MNIALFATQKTKKQKTKKSNTKNILVFGHFSVSISLKCKMSKCDDKRYLIIFTGYKMCCVLCYAADDDVANEMTTGQRLAKMATQNRPPHIVVSASTAYRSPSTKHMPCVHQAHHHVFVLHQIRFNTHT